MVLGGFQSRKCRNLGSGCLTVNRGQIRQAVIAILRETSTPTGWTSDELDRYINDVYSDTAKETKSVILTVDIPAPSGVNVIDIPVNAIQTLAVFDKATGEPIDPVDWLWIDKRNRTFIRRSDTRARYVAPFGMHSWFIYPHYTPEGTITATFTADATPMTSDTDIPAIPETFHRSLTYGAAHRAMMKDAKGKKIRMAMKEFVRWRKSLGELSTWANQRHEKITLSNHGNSLRNARAGTTGRYR